MKLVRGELTDERIVTLSKCYIAKAIVKEQRGCGDFYSDADAYDTLVFRWDDYVAAIHRNDQSAVRDAAVQIAAACIRHAAQIDLGIEASAT